MRTFIAIELPFEIKEKIAKITQPLQDLKLNVNWVKSQNLHLTLKFLGEIKETELDKITEIVDKTAKSFKAFRANLGTFGFFPNEKRPGVFFIEAKTKNTLESIAETLESLLEKIGFKKKGRFKSHITLARIKNPDNIESLKNELGKIIFKEEFLVKEIVLFKSILTSYGPIYEKIFNSNFTV
ncbi:MAG: RNA 2',3'-cyclic phosphodiesterase [Candidatus Omnitrophica bacterium]|jgi:2'-5' RNA ligase|nr:RNA 2',3'-cyclic phosphodiesterase [Candidatus Omnitrophota bacterium]